MTERLRRLLGQKTTWLGLASIIVIVLQALGLDIDDGTREAITETLLVVSGLVLVLVDPDKKQKLTTQTGATGGTDSDSIDQPDRPLRPGSAAAIPPRPDERAHDGGAKAP